MKTVNTISVTDLLPSSLARSQTVRDVAKACGASLHDVVDRMSGLLIYSRIDELGEAVVDDLAWQFHVDFYDTGLNLTQKRALVKSAIKDHKYKGTPWALTQAVRQVIPDGKIREWQDYGGEPYRFRVTTERGLSSTTHLRNLLRSIANHKNVRSRLDGIEQEITVPATMYTSAKLVMKQEITLYPASQTVNSITTSLYIGIARQEQKEIEIRGDFSGSVE